MSSQVVSKKKNKKHGHCEANLLRGLFFCCAGGRCNAKTCANCTTSASTPRQLPTQPEFRHDQSGQVLNFNPHFPFLSMSCSPTHFLSSWTLYPFGKTMLLVTRSSVHFFSSTQEVGQKLQLDVSSYAPFVDVLGVRFFPMPRNLRPRLQGERRPLWPADSDLGLQNGGSPPPFRPV